MLLISELPFDNVFLPVISVLLTDSKASKLNYSDVLLWLPQLINDQTTIRP